MSTLYWGLEKKKSPVAWPLHLLCLGLVSTDLKRAGREYSSNQKGTSQCLSFPDIFRTSFNGLCVGNSEHYVQNAFNGKTE